MNFKPRSKNNGQFMKKLLPKSIKSNLKTFIKTST